MNIRKHVIASLASAALALGLATVPASAESALKGTFELPAAAYWGDTLLQPGQYTIWMISDMHDIAHVPIIHVTGEGVSKTFLAIAKPVQESSRNYLEVTNIDGTYVIRAFDAALLGESFGFGVTKAVKEKAKSASAEPVSISLPVYTASAR